MGFEVFYLWVNPNTLLSMEIQVNLLRILLGLLLSLGPIPLLAASSEHEPLVIVSGSIWNTVGNQILTFRKESKSYWWNY